jgi:hypothetical protein
LYCPEKVSQAARRHCHVVYSVRDAQAHQLRLTMSGPIGAADAVFSSPLHVTAAAWSTANVVKTSHRYFPQGHVGSSVPHRNIIKSSQLRQNDLRRKMAKNGRSTGNRGTVKLRMGSGPSATDDCRTKKHGEPA